MREQDLRAALEEMKRLHAEDHARAEEAERQYVWALHQYTETKEQYEKAREREETATEDRDGARRERDDLRKQLEEAQDKLHLLETGTQAAAVQGEAAWRERALVGEKALEEAQAEAAAMRELARQALNHAKHAAEDLPRGTTIRDDYLERQKQLDDEFNATDAGRDSIDRLRKAEAKLCDQCDGSGQYYIDGEPQTCICVGEKKPYQRLEDRAEFAEAALKRAVEAAFRRLRDRVKELEAKTEKRIEAIRESHARELDAVEQDRDGGLVNQHEFKVEIDRLEEERMKLIEERDAAEAESARLAKQMGAQSHCQWPHAEDLDWMETAVQRHTGGAEAWWKENKKHFSFRDAVEIFICIWEAGRSVRVKPEERAAAKEGEDRIGLGVVSAKRIARDMIEEVKLADETGA